MKAKSIKGGSPEEISAALQESMRDGFQPTLAIVFISISQDRNAVCDILEKQGIDIVGATSCGEFIEGYQGVGSIVILLIELKKETYSVLFEDAGGREISEMAQQVAEGALKKFAKPALIVCSTGVSSRGEIFSGDVFMRSLSAALNRPIKIYGGMAGDDSSFTGTHVFTGGRSTDRGIVALVLDEEKVSLHGMAISGWKPIGLTRVATRSEDGWLHTIDDQPALDMYLKYLGKQPKIKDETMKIFQDVGLFYPLQVEDAPDPVLRTPIQIDEERNAIRFDFPIPEGTRLRFSMPPDFEVVESILEKAGEVKSGSGSNAEALLVFSCAGRLSALGPLANIENEGLQKIWNAPMAGFFTYGEYGTSDGKQQFHSTTCSWVALSEKQ